MQKSGPKVANGTLFVRYREQCISGCTFLDTFLLKITKKVLWFALYIIQAVEVWAKRHFCVSKNKRSAIWKIQRTRVWRALWNENVGATQYHHHYAIILHCDLTSLSKCNKVQLWGSRLNHPGARGEWKFIKIFSIAQCREQSLLFVRWKSSNYYLPCFCGRRSHNNRRRFWAIFIVGGYLLSERDGSPIQLRNTRTCWVLLFSANIRIQ